MVCYSAMPEVFFREEDADRQARLWQRDAYYVFRFLRAAIAGGSE